MGEARRKNESRKNILQRESRCIYCSGPAETLEHMPPRGMFRERQRPGFMEYGCCITCNGRTRGSDAVAAFLSRQHPDNADGGWQDKEGRKLISAIEAYAPGVREELTAHDKASYKWLPRAGSGILQRIIIVRADGPLLHGHLSAFGAKMAMALYREHVGEALPLDGAAWCQFSLNGGMTQADLEARIRILPLHETLRQGEKTVGDQFAYRYNCDGRTVVAAVAQFHRGLWLTMFASSDQRIISLFETPNFLALPGSCLVRPGGIAALVPKAQGAHLIAARN